MCYAVGMKGIFLPKNNRRARFPWKLSRKNHPRLGMFLLVDFGVGAQA